MAGPSHPTARPRRRAAGALAALLALAGCALPEPAPPAPPAPPPIHAPADPGAAPPAPAEAGPGPAAAAIRGLLGELPVKGRAPRTGYDRAEFGQRWSDDVPVALGHNGCDTRNDILRRDLRRVELKPGTRDCVVLAGVLEDPYTGKVIGFRRGPETSRAVHVDHVVALSDAWQKGARALDPDERRALANDPLNLLAVDGPANMAKGDGDAATWQPPNRAFRCAYAARQTAVKHRYRLWVTAAEAEALGRWLDRCGGADEPALAALLEGAEAARPEVARG